MALCAVASAAAAATTPAKDQEQEARSRAVTHLLRIFQATDQFEQKAAGTSRATLVLQQQKQHQPASLLHRFSRTQTHLPACLSGAEPDQKVISGKSLPEIRQQRGAVVSEDQKACSRYGKEQQ